jgi:hypothetical protein
LSGNTSLTLENQQSGGTIPTMYFALVDKYGEYIGSDLSSTITLNINTTKTYSNYYPILNGVTSVKARKGVFVLQDVTFTSEPNSDHRKLQIIYKLWV